MRTTINFRLFGSSVALISRWAITFLVVFFCHTTLLSQSIQRTITSGCVGVENEFVFTRSDCSFNWVISGTYQIISQSGQTIRLKWTAPSASVTVSVNYSNCTYYPYANGGSTSYPAFKIINATASISPSGSVTVCSNCSQTLSASPTGTGYSYVWKKEPTTVGTSSSFAASVAGSYTVETNYDGCKKTSSATVLSKNAKALVNAGADRTIFLPDNSLVLQGTASDPDGTISTRAWSVVAGPNTPTFGTPGALTTTMTNLVRGSYLVRLSVTDNFGEVATDDVTITLDYPPNNHNYVRTTKVNKAGVTEAQIPSLTIGDKTETTAYFDVLGRPVQSVMTKGSPNMLDMVEAQSYDALGREVRRYLPFEKAESNGYYKDNAVKSIATYTTSDQYQFYTTFPAGNIAQDERPFTELNYETSPLNRPVKTFGPGKSWFENNKSTDVVYTTNFNGTTTGKERVIVWVMSGNVPVRKTTYNSGYYADGDLDVEVAVDEHGSVSRTYKNKLGQVVLKKIHLQGTVTDINNKDNWAQTYYVYDDLGLLRIVLQPELSKTLSASTTSNPSQTALNQGAFQYRYDIWKRMTEKTVPGAQTVYMVYDARDRVVLTQDGNQRNLTSKEWTFTKYDELNRPVLTGKYLNNGLLATVQSAVNTFYSSLGTTKQWYETYISSLAGNVLGYDNKSFPQITDVAQYYSVTYYDSYDNYIVPSGFAYLFQSLAGQEADRNANVKGQVTATLVKNLASGAWLRTVNYYDRKYQSIQSVSEHPKGSIRTSTAYDFSGAPTISQRTYTVNGSSTVIRERYAYDHANRPTTVLHAVNGGTEVMISSNVYNKLGQLADKLLHSQANGTNPKQSVDYRYNIRGWLTKINEFDVSAQAAGDPSVDYFGMELNYNDVVPALSADSLYNGNISSMRYSQGNGGNVRKHAYAYHYDKLNRLGTANHFDYLNVSGSMTWTANNQAFDEAMTYDHNGNIKTLARKGFGGSILDNLVYSYTGNQLNYVNDSGSPTAGFIEGNTGTDDYSYDFNGNLDKDRNKGLSNKGDIKYNFLNLPREVVKGSEKVIYAYDATGRKLTQELYGSSGTLVKKTDYMGELIFENDQLQLIQQAEGRVLPDGAGWEYQYHLKDHLGNVRVTFTTKPVTTQTSTANFENGNANSGESAGFLNYSSYNFDLVDHTDAGTVYTRTQRIDQGVTTGRVGLAKSQAVLPGDEITFSAYAKYRNLTTTQNSQALIQSLAAAFGVSSSSTGEQLKVYNGLNAYSAIVPAGDHTGDDDGVPKIFVTILFFDKDYNLVDGAWDQISAAGAQTSPTVKQPHDLITITAKAPEAGYAYAFLSNEHPTIVEAYFDDATFSYKPSPIVSGDEYYPFGLTFNSHSRENSIYNKYQYNGKEIQNELGLRWNDFGARMYMSDIGRWGVIDNKAEKYMLSSPYVYAANNPVVFIDPDGNEIGNPNSESTQRIKSTLLKTETGTKIWKQMESSKRVIYFHIAGGDSKSDKAIQGHLRGQNAKGETVTGKMFKKIQEGKEVGNAEKESAYSFNETSGDHDKTTDWDETHVIIDGPMVEVDELVAEVNGEKVGSALVEVAAHEGKHTVQNKADFAKKVKDPKTGKYKDPKKDKDGGASRSKSYEESEHEKEADAAGKKAREEYNSN